MSTKAYHWTPVSMVSFTCFSTPFFLGKNPSVGRKKNTQRRNRASSSLTLRASLPAMGGRHHWDKTPLRAPPGAGNGNPLQYSCLEKDPMDRRAWVATVPGIVNS